MAKKRRAKRAIRRTKQEGFDPDLYKQPVWLDVAFWGGMALLLVFLVSLRVENRHEAERLRKELGLQG